VNTFAESLPPTSPTPHMMPWYEPGSSVLFEDQFYENTNSWTVYEESGVLEFKDEKLYLKSAYPDNFAIANCAGRKCEPPTNPYYIQADLNTDKQTDINFGLALGMKYNSGNFYIFTINAESKRYFFYHHTPKQWVLLTTGSSPNIHTYPDGNTIGIYIKEGLMEFYINNTFTDIYYETGAKIITGDIGFYADNAGFKLIGDKLIIDAVGEEKPNG
jgi:hypothetical protein